MKKITDKGKKEIKLVDNTVVKMGRPKKYSQALAARICLAVSTSTDSLELICKKNPDFPCAGTIYAWRLEYYNFSEMYVDAKRIQAELYIEEIIAISDNTSKDTLIAENGKETCNSEWIARSRLRVDTRKWIACKLVPRLYGDKVEHKQTIVVKHEDALKELE